MRDQSLWLSKFMSLGLPCARALLPPLDSVCSDMQHSGTCALCSLMLFKSNRLFLLKSITWVKQALDWLFPFLFWLFPACNSQTVPSLFHSSAPVQHPKPECIGSFCLCDDAAAPKLPPGQEESSFTFPTVASCIISLFVPRLLQAAKLLGQADEKKGATQFCLVKNQPTNLGINWLYWVLSSPS